MKPFKFVLLFAIAALYGCAGYQYQFTMRVNKIARSGDVIKVDFVRDTSGLPTYSELGTLEQTATVSYLPDDPVIKEIYVGDLFKMTCATDGGGNFIFDETCRILEKVEK